MNAEAFAVTERACATVGWDQRRVGDPVAVLPVLFHLLWTRELSVDLTGAGLGPHSVISVEGER